MAKSKSSGGSTVYGMLAGLLLGLGLAAGVAYYVIKAPMPFVDKASRSPDSPGVPDPRNPPDPNAALGNREVGPVTAPSGPDQPTGQADLSGQGSQQPAAGTSKQGGDALGSLIATLTPAPNVASRNPQTTTTNTPSAPARTESASPPSAGGPYYLQVGSFRVLEDAEALRAKILLMGMSVEIQRAEVNGLQVNRVRVGPFVKIDDMNQTRIRLGQEKIPTAVVRQ
ncbi:MAG: SPOR domain-containing protein [Burkholderiaceae bacterium]|nr:SPOR domain-containing protein [Burkholderiaceae bacterium]